MHFPRGRKPMRPHDGWTRRAVLRRAGLAACAIAAPGVRAVSAPVRIVHVMSFESPWRWTDGQLAGFKQALDLPGAQWRVFQMDVKRHRTAAEKADRGRLARELIEQWKPDLVYLSDDDAVEQVARAFAGSALPIVFSGVNRSLADHGLEGAPNVTGVLEREHVTETLRLLQAVVPAARRIAVVSDPSPYWDSVIQRIRASVATMPGLGLTLVERPASYAKFQHCVLECAEQADAVLYLGVFALPRADGQSVPYPELARWVVQESRLPDMSFWLDRVYHGNLLSVTVSEHEQGLAAGRLAAAVLREGRSPASLPVQPTRFGHPAISLARARQLGINVRSTQLLASEVVRQFVWEGAL